MPTFGVVTRPEHADALRAVGWDFVEANAWKDLAGGDAPDRDDDAAWRRDAMPTLTGRALPVAACAGLLPGTPKVVGPETDDAATDAYLARVLRRAAAAGVNTLVFGSGKARNVPDGFDRGRAAAQITDFLKRSAPVAAEHGVTIAVEPLNRGECNLVNTVAEAMTHVRAVGHPSVQCLLDTYHLWVEGEPADHVRDAMPHVRHVHVADRDGRVAPGESGTSDYRPLFGALKAGGYDGGVSVECRDFDPADPVEEQPRPVVLAGRSG